jgi:hypothetical protein
MNASSESKETIMARTAVATLQTVWDCRWSRPGFRLSGVKESLQPESLFVCIGSGCRQDVTDATCASCWHWELDRRESIEPGVHDRAK